MTSSPSESGAGGDGLASYADQVAHSVGGSAKILAGTVKVKVGRSDWVTALGKARDDLGLVFFSWLSAIDWSNEVAAGDPPSEGVEERLELVCTVADLSEGHRVTFSTDLPHDDPRVASLVDVYAGANWHEREAWEMFGIDFEGHPDLTHLYLPEAFLGNPLRKSFPLLSREVKPWPGSVDVEGLPGAPSEENPEA